jgi:hypothetical protein
VADKKLNRARRLFLFLLGLAGLTLLAACGRSWNDALISNVSQSTDTIVPGSTGVGKPPGAIEVRYTLSEAANVEADLRRGGPLYDGFGGTTTTLLVGRQDAGEHVLRFNGVITSSIEAGPEGVVRQVITNGNYTISIHAWNLAAGDSQVAVYFKVENADTEPPALSSVLVHPDVISPNSDAVDDVAEVTFRTNETSTLSVDLTGQNGTAVQVLAPFEKGPGEQNIVVNGQDQLGNILPDGTYTVTVRAEDKVGNRVEAQRPLKIQGGGTPQIEIVKVDIAPQQLILGGSIAVSITVKNVGNVPLRTQGPDPGYTYTTNDSYSSIEGQKWTDKAGLWRVGVDWDGNSGGAGPYRYPFRWGFGHTLMPGEQVTTGGKITILKQERKMWFYAGVLQEGIRIVLDRLGRTDVDVSF